MLERVWICQSVILATWLYQLSIDFNQLSINFSYQSIDFNYQLLLVINWFWITIDFSFQLIKWSKRWNILPSNQSSMLMMINGSKSKIKQLHSCIFPARFYSIFYSSCDSVVKILKIESFWLWSQVFCLFVSTFLLVINFTARITVAPRWKVK